MNNFKILLEKLTIDELHNYDYIFSEWDRGIGHGAIAKSFSKGEVATRKAILKYLQQHEGKDFSMAKSETKQVLDYFITKFRKENRFDK